MGWTTSQKSTSISTFNHWLGEAQCKDIRATNGLVPWPPLANERLDPKKTKELSLSMAEDSSSKKITSFLSRWLFSCFPCFASYGFWKPSSSCRRRSCPVNLHFGRVWAFSILERHETNETSWHWGVKKPEIQLQIASMISMCIPCSLNHHDQLANHPITAPDCFISDQMIYVGLFRLFKSLLRYVIRRARQRCHKDRKARRFAKKFDNTPKWPVLVKTYRTTSLVCLERI